jgi:hypothetical protein
VASADRNIIDLQLRRLGHYFVRLGTAKPAEPQLALGAAVRSEMAYLGNVGSEVVDFTALRDTVNTASRMASSPTAGEVLLSETVYPKITRGCRTQRGAHSRYEARRFPLKFGFFAEPKLPNLNWIVFLFLNLERPLVRCNPTAFREPQSCVRILDSASSSHRGF